MKAYTTKQVSQSEKCGESTARRWASKNNVQKLGRDFVWNDENIEQFRNRGRPGGWRGRSLPKK